MTAQDRITELEARQSVLMTDYDRLMRVLQTVAQELTEIHVELTRLKEGSHV